MKSLHSIPKRNGFATVAVIILLMAASAWMMTTVKTHRNLHQELRLLEKKHQRHWEIYQNGKKKSGAQTGNDSEAEKRKETESAGEGEAEP